MLGFFKNITDGLGYFNVRLGCLCMPSTYVICANGSTPIYKYNPKQQRHRF